MKIRMAFSNKLYELRKQKGYSQEDLANQLNVSRQTISKWETGETSPELEKVIDLGKIFGLSLDELILEKEKTVLLEEEKFSSLEKIVNYIQVNVANKQNILIIKKIGKYLLWVILAILAIEIIVMIHYVLKYGIPPM